MGLNRLPPAFVRCVEDAEMTFLVELWKMTTLTWWVQLSYFAVRWSNP
jgi:hypothetical protein